MELREYWRILRRRWWLPVLLTALVVILSLVTTRTPAPTYQASIRFTIGVSADRPVQGVDPILTAYQASEYIRDDFVEILGSEEFARDVNAMLNDPTLKVSRGSISGAVEKQRRIMSMAILWGDPAQAQRIADAAAKTLETENAKYFKQLGSDGASVTIIDGPDVAPVPPSLRERFDLLIRAALAFAIGVLLVFVWDYFDNSVRDAGELERLGLPVLAEIPREKARR